MEVGGPRFSDESPDRTGALNSIKARLCGYICTILVNQCIKLVHTQAIPALPILKKLRIMAHWLRWSAKFGVLAHIVL